ncbi:conserved Plasmodium protein, unknown function [Babesia microti strain RI]|uniref:Uncharacterized protein n=1 Tax=Babesia microti (strain RI) TaxID=1133968 RepID=I7J5P3_BABMR|nr:conserved Plasmodium protein, unknown function [Babesia microti strain RI]CCF73082.1 conserved Plasmodium protein, unknown function [Babesia microti strain RI]|eukprot:XP_012647691.1 conserved Plasmodium protein, unknown function [Babesia microti strain RI]
MNCFEYNRERGKSLYKLATIDPKFKSFTNKTKQTINSDLNNQTKSIQIPSNFSACMEGTAVVYDKKFNQCNSYCNKHIGNSYISDNIIDDMQINHTKCLNCEKFICRYKSTLEILSRTRKELLNISSILLKKESTIAFLENVACGCEIEINSNIGKINQLEIDIECLKKDNQYNVDVLKSQIRVLDDQIVGKDRNIMELKKSVFEYQAKLKILQAKNTSLTNELENTCSQMDALVTSTSDKCILLNEMEKNMRDIELARQKEFMEQMRVNRNLELDFKFNHNVAANLLNKKSNELDVLRAKLTTCQDGIEKVVSAAKQINPN